MSDIFVKLEDGKLVYPPLNKGNTINYGICEELLRADGYKLFIEGTKEEGKLYHESFEETEDSITQVFTEFTEEEYEEEAIRKAQEERARKDRMSLTPADVERALYRAEKKDFEDLKVLIAQALPSVDMKELSIEFRAKDFYRGAMANGMRLFDVVGALLGYTPDDMDYLFEHKELPEKEEPEEEEE